MPLCRECECVLWRVPETCGTCAAQRPVLPRASGPAPLRPVRLATATATATASALPVLAAVDGAFRWLLTSAPAP